MTTEAGTTTKSAGETTSGDFEPEQKRYLEGFVAGLQIAKTAKGIAAPAADASPASKEAIGPDAAARKAQDRVLAAGGKLDGRLFDQHSAQRVRPGAAVGRRQRRQQTC